MVDLQVFGQTVFCVLSFHRVRIRKILVSRNGIVKYCSFVLDTVQDRIANEHMNTINCNPKAIDA